MIEGASFDMELQLKSYIKEGFTASESFDQAIIVIFFHVDDKNDDTIFFDQYDVSQIGQAFNFNLNSALSKVGF
jgi:hypothetical protein